MRTFTLNGSRRRKARRRIAVLASCSLLLAQIAPATLAQTSKAKPKTPPPVDGGWPRSYVTSSSAALVIYQPQVADWKDQTHMTVYMAITYTPKGGQRAVGTVKIEANTAVAVDQRLVNFSEFVITESNFPSLGKDELQQLLSDINTSVPREQRVIALDRVLADLDKSTIRPKNVADVKADPPTVFYSDLPAVLVNIDGDPVWSPIEGNDLKYAVNTNWDLFQYPPTNTYYLRNKSTWLKASSVEGPWTPAGPLPASFSKLPTNNGNFKDVLAAVPGRPLSVSMMPRVFVTLKPAELILVNGAPNYTPVSGTRLLWVANTDSDVFRLGLNGLVYYLVSGRWFSAPHFEGPWTFTTLNLPDDFKHIPLEHARSRVRASVPGTEEAAEAVLLAEVPHTASVRKNTKAPEVKYDGGEAKFESIQTTTVSYAVNTDKEIIKDGDLYYMCFQGVWFMSRSATGPWEVTGSVPSAIYTIPPSSPVYNVTSVTVVQDNSDAVVFATAAAYTGLMIAFGCAVWGTGYYYPPYVHYGGFYPVYHPYYPTYGYAASYNPWTGSYARGAAVYGPYGGAGVGARYNPTTGTYARGAVAYGPYGAQGAAQAYNPRTGAYGATRQGSNVYGNWGASTVQRGDQWATTAHTTNYATGVTRGSMQSSAGSAVARSGPMGSSFAGASTSGDLYAGHDGNVYKNEGGGWQKYDNGSWNSTQASGQLSHDYSSRAEGAQRTNDFGSWSSRFSGSGGGSWGSFRSSGGGWGARRR